MTSLRAGVYSFSRLIDEGILAVSDGYRAKNDELGGDGPIFLRAGHVTDSHIDFSGVDRFRSYLTPRLASKLSVPGDVIVTTKGNSTGRVSYVTADMPPFVYSPHLSFWRSLRPDCLVPEFLRYWSLGREFREQLSGFSASTDMAPYLSLMDQKRLRITLPDPVEQDRIGRTLGNLDRKIALNRRMNQTLEAMARALFKAWFVDFDPTFRRLQFLSPNSSLSRAGQIPAGWQARGIGDTVTVVGGSTPSTDNQEFWNGPYHFATSRDLSRLTAPHTLGNGKDDY